MRRYLRPRPGSYSPLSVRDLHVNNVFRIEGPGINPTPADPATACPGAVGNANCIQTNLFVMNAQLAPGLSQAPNNLTFAAQAVGTTSGAQTVTVTNTGAAAITVGAPTITGANAAEFAVATNTCAAVAPGGTCSIGVTFKPTALAATHAASLSIPGDVTGPLTVALSGATPAPVASVTPATVTFPDTHGEQAIEERVLRRGSLEARQGTEIVVRVVAHASECHMDQRPVVGFERHTEIELARSVGGRGHPIGAAEHGSA